MWDFDSQLVRPEVAQAASAWSTSVTGCLAPIRAGTMVSAAIATTAPSTAAASHVGGGKVPPWTAALNSKTPRGMPRMAPGNAERTCAKTSPEETCRVRAHA